MEYLHYYSFTSTHDPAFGPAVKRKFKAGGGHSFKAMEIGCPVAISEYNKHIAGVDLKYHRTSVRKGLKRLMQLAIFAITTSPRARAHPGDLHQKFAPSLGLLHPSFFWGGGGHLLG